MMNLRHFTLVVVVVFAVLATGCARVNSDEVNPAAIKTFYEAQYDQSTKIVSVWARFSTGNSEQSKQVVLTQGSRVVFNGRELQKYGQYMDDVIYKYAELSDGNVLNQDMQFEYYDNRGQVYVNRFQFPQEVEFQITPGSKTSGFTVQWKTQTPLAGHEIIYAVFANSMQNLRLYDRSVARDQGQITFSTEYIRHLDAGDFPLYLGRLKSVDGIQAPAAGGRLTIETLTEKKRFMLHEN